MSSRGSHRPAGFGADRTSTRSGAMKEIGPVDHTLPAPTHLLVVRVADGSFPIKLMAGIAAALVGVAGIFAIFSRRLSQAAAGSTPIVVCTIPLAASLLLVAATAIASPSAAHPFIRATAKSNSHTDPLRADNPALAPPTPPRRCLRFWRIATERTSLENGRVFSAIAIKDSDWIPLTQLL